MHTTPQIRGRLLAPAAEPLPVSVLGATSQDRAWFGRLLTKGEILADFGAIVGAVTSSYALYHFFHLGKQVYYSRFTVLEMAGVFALLCVSMLDRNGAYRGDSSLLLVKETERILRVSSQAFLVTFCISLLSSYLVSRWMITIAFLMVPLFLIVEKQLLAGVVRALHARGYGLRRVVIYGAGLTGRRIFSALARSPRLGLDPMAFADDDPSLAGTTIFEASYSRRRCSAVVFEGLPSDAFLREHNVDMIVIAVPSISREKFSAIATCAASAGAAISFVPHHFAPSDHWVDYVNLDGMLLASFEGPLSHSSYDSLKRSVDLVLGITLLVLASPLWLVLALLIRVTSGGPVLFVHERVGQNGKRFKIYKFRTMHADAQPYAPSPEKPTDARISPMGRFLRRTSLDEIPQLLNVIKGEMSLVGPRPEMPFIVEQYTWLQRQRLIVKPGITGLWQLSADRKFPIHENIEYDLYYIRNRKLFMDLAILLHTFIFATHGI